MSETTEPTTPAAETPPAKSPAERIADEFPRDPLEDGWQVGEETSEAEGQSAGDELDALRTANDTNAELLDMRRQEREQHLGEVAAYRDDQVVEAALEAYDGGGDPAEIMEELARVSPQAAAEFFEVWREDEADDPEPLTAEEFAADVGARYEAFQTSEQQAAFEADTARKRELAERELERMTRELPDFQRRSSLLAALSAEPIAQLPPEQTVDVLRDSFAVARALGAAERVARIQTDAARAQWEDDQWLSGKPPAAFDEAAVMAENYRRALPDYVRDPSADIPRVRTRQETVDAARASVMPDEQERADEEAWAGVRGADFETRRQEDARSRPRYGPR